VTVQELWDVLKIDLKIDIDSYALFMSTNDFERLPVNAKSILHVMMREEEKIICSNT
jgi:hypothetical protein